MCSELFLENPCVFPCITLRLLTLVYPSIVLLPLMVRPLVEDWLSMVQVLQGGEGRGQGQQTQEEE